MKKFAIDLGVLKDKVLLECIIRKSKVAVKVKKFEDYYTYNGSPKNWQKHLIEDIRSAEEMTYNNKRFLISRVEADNTIAYVFHEDCLYYFDPFFTDCKIFADILKNYE